jgi:hypothetical protein
MSPRNVWLVAGTSVFQPYPCRCGGWQQCSPLWCPCAGRLDVWNWPPSCCAWVHTPRVAAMAQAEYNASRGWY